MCETRREFRQTRMTYNKSADEKPDTEQAPQVRPPRSTRPPRAEGSGDAAAPRARGSGPRDGAEWTLVADSAKKPAGGRGRGRPPRSKENA